MRSLDLAFTIGLVDGKNDRMALNEKKLDDFDDSEHLCAAAYEVVENFQKHDVVWTNCFLTEIGLKDAKLSSMAIKYSRLERCYLRGANLINVDLTGSEFTGCNLRNASFDKCKLWYVSFSHCIVDYENILRCLPKELNIRCQVLHTLRLNALSMGEIRQADHLLLLEMEADRMEQWNIFSLASPWHKKRYKGADRAKALWRWIVHHVEKGVWGYGVKMFSILKVCMCVLLLSSGLLWLTETKLIVTSGVAGAQDFCTCLYAATVAFSTIGFGDAIATSGFGRFILSATGLVGPVCLGLFTAAAYRRIQR